MTEEDAYFAISEMLNAGQSSDAILAQATQLGFDRSVVAEILDKIESEKVSARSTKRSGNPYSPPEVGMGRTGIWPTNYEDVPFYRRHGFCSGVILTHLAVTLFGACIPFPCF